MTAEEYAKYDEKVGQLIHRHVKIEWELKQKHAAEVRELKKRIRALEWALEDAQEED